MDHFYDNSLQTGLMRDLAIDLESLGEHLVLLGNQVISRKRFDSQPYPESFLRELEKIRLLTGQFEHTFTFYVFDYFLLADYVK
jgi:hypothetical protein